MDYNTVVSYLNGIAYRSREWYHELVGMNSLGAAFVLLGAALSLAAYEKVVAFPVQSPYPEL